MKDSIGTDYGFSPMIGDHADIETRPEDVEPARRFLERHGAGDLLECLGIKSVAK